MGWRGNAAEQTELIDNRVRERSQSVRGELVDLVSRSGAEGEFRPEQFL